MTIVTKCKQTTTKSATHCLKTWFSGWRSWPAVDPKCHATVYVVLTGKETVKWRWFISPFTNTNPSSGVSLFSYFVIENKQIVVLETTESPQGPLVFCDCTNNHPNNNVTLNQDVLSPGPDDKAWKQTCQHSPVWTFSPSCSWLVTPRVNLLISWRFKWILK